MKNVYIYCEGQTEESFVREILYPYFINSGVYVCPIICTTKRTASKKYKGGVSDYEKIKRELTALCRQHHNEYVTTMFDYYAMPDNTPGIDCIIPDIYERIRWIEHTIDDDINLANSILCSMSLKGFCFQNPIHLL